MVDTINININITPDEVFYVSEKLTKRYRINNDEGDQKIEGMFHNFKIRLFRGMIYISGSLSKYYKGSNIYDLTLQEIREAINKLSGELNINLLDAKITRIDIAANLEVKKACHYYLNVLKGVPKFKKKGYSNSTLTFYTSRETITFYDKVKEVIKRKEDIPSFFRGKKFLRYELRMKSNLKNFFGKGIFVREMLTDNIYNTLINRWYKRFNDIEKNSVPTLGTIAENSTQKDFMNRLLVAGIYSIGYNNLLEELESSRDCLSKNNYSRIKQRLKELTNNNDYFPNDKIITEINNLVTKIAEKNGIV